MNTEPSALTCDTLNISTEMVVVLKTLLECSKSPLTTTPFKRSITSKSHQNPVQAYLALSLCLSVGHAISEDQDKMLTNQSFSTNKRGG